MEYEKELSEYLQHIRLIHLSLLVVSATITYMVLSTWSSANELVIDLNDFTQTIQNAAQSGKDPQKLADILQDWRKIGIEPTKKSIEAQLGRTIAFNVGHDPLRILGVTPGPLPSEFKSLEESRSELERRSWTIEVPDGIQSDLSDVRDWVLGVSAQGDLFTNSRPAISMDIKSWPSDAQPAQPGHADLEVNITVMVTEYERTANGNMQPKSSPKFFTHTFQNKEWLSRSVSVSLTPEWLSTRFYWMTTYWNSIKFYPYQRALDWANNQRTEELKSRNPNLFGIEIKGQHIGYVGPLLTGCLLVYLLSYLTQLNSFVKQDNARSGALSEMLSPWIGTMTNWWAVIITLISLVAGPIAAIGLPLWRLLGLHWFFSALLALCAGLLGFRCAWISRTLFVSPPANAAGTKPVPNSGL